jgi:Spy/CpxP family protein refolding chaperone
MTRTKGLALAFYLGAVVAGVAIGITADRWLRPSPVTRMSGPQMREWFARELKLTDNQRTTVDSILDARSRAESLLVAPIRPQLDSIRTDARGRISALLTPEQVRVYEQMQRDQKARAQEKK